ncbi:hypothetical protein STEG23_010624, partial [Scotinomys teguina]
MRSSRGSGSHIARTSRTSCGHHVLLHAGITRQQRTAAPYTLRLAVAVQLRSIGERIQRLPVLRKQDHLRRWPDDIHLLSFVNVDRISVWMHTTFSLSASLMTDSYGDLVTAPVTSAAINIGV